MFVDLKSLLLYISTLALSTCRVQDCLKVILSTIHQWFFAYALGYVNLVTLCMLSLGTLKPLLIVLYMLSSLHDCNCAILIVFSHCWSTKKIPRSLCRNTSRTLWYCFSIQHLYFWYLNDKYATRCNFICKQLTRYLREYLEGKKRMALVWIFQFQ